MTEIPPIEQVEATCFLRRTADSLAGSPASLAGFPASLEQLLRLELHNPGPAAEFSLRAVLAGQERELPLGWLPQGSSQREIYLPAVQHETAAALSLAQGGQSGPAYPFTHRPARHWSVHVVQNSHHDLGYTGLPSHILDLHTRWLDEALEHARASDAYPEEARFRIVIEQAWSLEGYLERATTARAAQMLARLREGRFELNALYANLTTELCSPEELVRALYPAARIQCQHGLPPLLSAEHNDITGFSWGLASALIGAGVRLFVPGLPLYYSWGQAGLESFWDAQAILPHGGPGAFWWQSPSANRLNPLERILVWCGGAGCGGDSRASLPGLAETLARLEQQGFPFQTLRWPVTGASSDNSPYRPDFADTIRDWNARWAWPKLTCSTNARFYAEFSREDLSRLPVLRGELPGQDYPAGAASTAAATGLNRRTHAALARAETAASLAGTVPGAEYPAARLDEAWRELLLHDEHTWGFHFPTGPAGEAHQAEKALHAYRAAALAQDASAKALAALGAGPSQPEEPCILVFNALGEARSAGVRMPLRPFDNIERVLSPQPGPDAASSTLQVTSLPGRNQLILPPAFLEGRFDLLDLQTGQRVPYQLEPLPDPETPLEYAAGRLGLGSGSKRLGLFEVARGLKVDLLFQAQDVPACGWKTYQLRPRPARPRFPALLTSRPDSIENEFYRLGWGRHGLESLVDKESGRELVDPAAPHAFGSLVLRGPRGEEQPWRVQRAWRGPRGPICASLELAGSAPGHPRARLSLRLQAGLKQVEVALNVLKDATPLLDLHLAFPFALPGARLRYEGVLAALSPVSDFLPGAQSDRLAVQNWVCASDGSLSLLWSALDAPVASLGGLWEGYVSPAHRCLLPASVHNHRRLQECDFQGAWIYSLLFSNNFGTNFAPSQPGYALFRYRFTTRSGPVRDAAAAAWGQAATSDLEPALLPARPATPAYSLARVEGARLLTVKRAEDGRGRVLRLWNPSEAASACRVTFPGLDQPRLELLDLTETRLLRALPGETAQIDLPPGGLATLRVA